MGADQVQVFGIRMVLGSARWTGGNVMPIQPETCQVYELDLLPETKPVHATFEPVMIGGHNQKQGDEGDERPITGLIPPHFVEGDRANRSDDEEDETPTGESGTRGGSEGDHAVEFGYQACQRMGFGRRRHGLVVEHSTDLTGWGCPRQSPGVVMADEWIDVTVRSDVDAAELLARIIHDGSWRNR